MEGNHGMNIPFSRPGALAKIFGFGLTLATTVLAGAALEPASAQSVARRYVVTNDNRANGAALAQSYSGRYPFAVTHSWIHNATGCLILTDNGSEGWPHSGQAATTGFKFPSQPGAFQLINGILVATVTQSSGTGGSASLVFTAPAGNGNIGNGVFEQVYGGLFDSGVLVFGTKGGC